MCIHMCTCVYYGIHTRPFFQIWSTCKPASTRSHFLEPFLKLKRWIFGKGESLVSVVWLSSNPVTGQSKFKRGLHSKADWKECPLKFVFIVIHNICMGQFHSPATPPIISYSSWLYSMTEIGKIQPVRMGEFEKANMFVFVQRLAHLARPHLY